MIESIATKPELKTFYFGYRLKNVRTNAIKDGKIQAKANLLGAAIADALEQLRGVFNNGLRVNTDEGIVCQLTNLETNQSGWFIGGLARTWKPE